MVIITKKKSNYLCKLCKKFFGEEFFKQFLPLLVSLIVGTFLLNYCIAPKFTPKPDFEIYCGSKLQSYVTIKNNGNLAGKNVLVGLKSNQKCSLSTDFLDSTRIDTSNLS